MIFRFERGNRLNHGLTGLRRLKAGAQWIYYGITIALIIHSLDPTLSARLIAPYKLFGRFIIPLIAPCKLV